MLAESGVSVGGGSGKSSPVVVAYDCARDDMVAFSLQLGAKNILIAQEGSHDPLAESNRVRSGRKYIFDCKAWWGIDTRQECRSRQAYREPS